MQSPGPQTYNPKSGNPDSLRQSPISGRLETIQKIMICDCLPIVGMLLSEIFKSLKLGYRPAA
jgi:hypothetical protein